MTRYEKILWTKIGAGVITGITSFIFSPNGPWWVYVLISLIVMGAWNNRGYKAARAHEAMAQAIADGVQRASAATSPTAKPPAPERAPRPRSAPRTPAPERAPRPLSAPRTPARLGH